MQHKFFIRCNNRLDEVVILLNQLHKIGISKNDIIIVSNGISKLGDYKIITLFENRGYQQGDADLLQECFLNTDDDIISHYLNNGIFIYDEKLFLDYLYYTENIKINNNKNFICISKGACLRNNISYNMHFQVSTGGIFSQSGKINLLKSLYREDFGKYNISYIENYYNDIDNYNELVNGNSWIEQFWGRNICNNEDIIWCTSERGIIYNGINTDSLIQKQSGTIRLNRNYFNDIMIDFVKNDKIKNFIT